MKHLLTAFLFTAFPIAFCPVFAQQQPPKARPADTTQEKFLEFADVSPEFPGGQEALARFLRDHTAYVNMAGKPEGLVILQFVVTESGQITEIKILQSLHPDLDSAAIAAVQAMPTWIPGSQNGKVEKVIFNLPVRVSKTMGKGKTKVKSKK